MKRHLSRPAVALLICLLAALAYFPVAHTRAAVKSAPVAFSATGKPFLNAQAARTIAVKYIGNASVVSEMQSGATARALMGADLDMDGAPDMIAAYKTASGGAVAITRGNPDAFAPKDPRILQQALKGSVPPALLSKTSVFSVPEAPDFLAVADFNHDGARDVLTATRGGGMYLLTADGNAHFGTAQRVTLPGDVSAFAASSGGHIAVGVQNGGNAQLLVFDTQSKSALKSPVATYSLSSPASAVEWGRLGYNSMDLAVASGSSVTVYYNALQKGAKSETINLAFRPQAIAIGEFTWDRDNRSEIAALAEDGSVHILEHGTLDTRATLASDGPARRARAMKLSKTRNLDPTTIGAWKDARNFPATSGVTDGVAPQSLLRISQAAPGGLLALDASSRRMNVISGAASASTSSVSLSASPVATVDLPVMADGRPGMAVLTDQASSFTVLPLATISISVTTTADEDSSGSCGAPVGVNSGTSLREAICQANNGAAGNTYQINVPAGTYNLSLGELQVGGNNSPSAFVINGAGAASTIISQTSTHERVIEQDFPFVGGHPVTISNVTISNGHCDSTGVDCTFGGGGILGTGTTGDNLSLTSVVVSNNTATFGIGGGVNTSSVGSFTVTSSTFSGNSTTFGSGGAFVFVPDPSGGGLSVTNSIFTGNSVTNGAGNSAAGGAIVVYPSGNSASITGSTFTGNSASASSSAQGGAVNANGNITMSGSRVVGNTVTATTAQGSGWYHSGGAGNTATLTNNWWGCNAGPGNSPCNRVEVAASTTANFNPWLVLAIGASPTSILPTQTSTVSVDLAHNSAAGSGFTVPDGVSLSFGATTFGTLTATSGTLTSGAFSTTYTAGSTAGNDSVSVTVDNQTVSATINVLDTVNFDTNPSGLQYTVDGTTYSTPQTFHWIVGSSHPVVAISPQAAVGTTQYDFNNWSDGGAASHSITAPTADTSYTAKFDLSPAITSANSVQFVENIKGTFSVTATGDPAPTFSETGTLPSGVTLAADGTLSGTPADGTAGVYPITITATNGAAPDATQSFTLTVRAQGIDLVEQNVSAGATPPASTHPRNLVAPGLSAGGTIYITDTTFNQGVNQSPLSRTQLYLSSDGVTLGRGLAYRNIPRLNSGDSSTATTAATLPSGISGTYYVIACADAANQAVESHENNNCTASASFSVSGADLVETSVTVPPSTPNGSITVNDTVTNQGLGAAGPSRTNFYISIDGTTQGQAIGFRNVPALAASGTSLGVTSVTLPAATTGTYYIIACADILNTVPESNETNNCTGSGPFTAPSPDLTESSVSVPASVTGATVSVTDTVSDSGTSAPFSRTTFYLSADGTTLGAALAFRNVPGVASGSTSTATTPVTLSANLKGTYYIIACADTNNAVSESNESNNCTASNSFTVAGADLTEGSVAVTTATPASGGSIQVNDTVTNSGSAAGSSRTNFYLSSDGTTKGATLAFRNVPGIAGGGGTSSSTTGMTLPSNLAGTYYIIACANATSTVPESNSANNCAASAGFSVGGADLVESSISVPASASGTIQVTDTTLNNGPGSAGPSRTTFYLSSDGSTIGKGLGFRNVPALGNGGSDSNSTLLPLPSGLAGTYYIIGCADSTNTVAEGNEGNNCSSSGAFTTP